MRNLATSLRQEKMALQTAKDNTDMKASHADLMKTRAEAASGLYAAILVVMDALITLADAGDY